VVVNGQRLTPTQRKALVFAVAQGINPRKTDIAPVVIDELAALGAIHMRQSKKGRPLWKATDAGRGAVAATGLAHTFLHRRGFPPYTADPSRAMRGEPEAFVS
jgi:hypothetical protein